MGKKNAQGAVESIEEQYEAMKKIVNDHFERLANRKIPEELISDGLCDHVEVDGKMKVSIESYNKKK